MKVSATDSHNVTAGFILKDREENILVEKSLQLNKENDHLEEMCIRDRGQVDERIRGLRMGADDYICKPFQIGELLARVETVLRLSLIHIYSQALHIRLIGTIQHSFWIFTDRHLTVWMVCQTEII